MSRKSATLSVAFAAAALLSLPAAFAADYSPTDDVDVEVDLEVNVEIDIKGIHYRNEIDAHVDDDHEISSHVDHTKAIDVHIDVDPVAAVPVVTDQSLIGEEFQLNGVDFINVVPLAVDGDTAQGNPGGVSEEEGFQNVQENKSVVVPDPPGSSLGQNLTGNSFNTAPVDDPIMQNTVNFSLTADGPITADIGVNAAAGAFNLQANSSVLAAGIGLLGESTADARQDTLSNGSVLQDATNEVMSTIDLQDVSANVGINLVSGVGNEQLNTFNARTFFAP